MVNPPNTPPAAFAGPPQVSAAPPGVASQSPSGNIGWGKIDPSQDFQTPVTEFVGTLEKVYTQQSPFQRDGKIEINNVLEFENCIILASDEPYPYSKVTLQIKDSNRMNSGWGVFSDTLREKFGLKTIDELALKPPTPGMRFWLCMQSDRVFFRNARKKEMGTGRAWHVMHVLDDGYAAETIIGVFGTPSAPTGGLSSEPFPDEAQAGVSGLAQAVELLHGKTADEFYAAAQNDPTIKADVGVMMQVNGQTFINTQVAAGKIGENQGRFYKIN